MKVGRQSPLSAKTTIEILLSPASLPWRGRPMPCSQPLSAICMWNPLICRRYVFLRWRAPTPPDLTTRAAATPFTGIDRDELPKLGRRPIGAGIAQLTEGLQRTHEPSAGYSAQIAVEQDRGVPGRQYAQYGRPARCEEITGGPTPPSRRRNLAAHPVPPASR